MANTCIVGIRIITASETDGERLYNRLMQMQADAALKKQGIFIGCEHRYLFDSAIYRDRDTIQISGSVKWGFYDDEAREFLAWLMKQVGIIKFHMDYDECGGLLYGYYDYENGKLTNCYLPSDYFPDDDDSDDFNIMLETALKRHGVTEEIPMPSR